MTKLAVVALGGNAILRGHQIGTIDEQEQNTYDTLENLLFLIRDGYNLVITHGNGPQVGNIMMRNDAGEAMYGIPQMPVDICVADSQGGIGYMIERMFHNVLLKHNLKKDIVTLVTLTRVDINDHAFKNPTKRVGKIYSASESEKLAKEKSWIFKQDTKTPDGWRRVVPSPEPKQIMNAKVIEKMAKQGTIIIAVGGGGIPVYIDEEGRVRPAEAVVDKDLASSLLATSIGADEFYILTDVPYVYINYKEPGEQAVEFLDKADTDRYLKAGMFGEGSMAPKIRASLHFIEGGGKKSVITEAFKLADKSFGTKITMNYED